MVEPTALDGVTEADRTVPIADVEVGDLVFLHPKDTHKLPQMIVKYDHGEFSHVGIVVARGMVASCRLNDESLERDRDLDFGGVRLNSMSELLKRKPFIGRPNVSQAERDAALEQVTSLVESGSDHPDTSAFSFPKLFIVAAALDAVQPGKTAAARRSILSTAAKAAASWSFAEQTAEGLLPTFFCSEVVAVGYGGKPFTYKDLENFEPVSPVGILPSLDDVWSFIRNLAADLARQDTTKEQRRDLKRMVQALLEHDRAFVGETAKALADLVRPLPDDEHPEEGVEGLASAPSDDDPLPTSLVTPRMLSKAAWLEWVRPLDSA